MPDKESPSIEEVLSRLENPKHVAEVLDLLLSRPEREALSLRFRIVVLQLADENLSQRDIARSVGCSQNTVIRARESLRRNPKVASRLRDVIHKQTE